MSTKARRERTPHLTPARREALLAEAKAVAQEMCGVAEWAQVEGLAGAWFPAEVAALEAGTP